MNLFGNMFRVSIYGESHGNGVGVVLDGVLPGIELEIEDFLPMLARRRAGGIGTTKRVEEDIPQIISGVFGGYTTGAPINLYFQNKNTESKVYADFKSHPRPGHADFTGTKKYEGYNDIRGGGHFSGRLTLALVVAGVVAKKIVDKVQERDLRIKDKKKIEIEAKISKIGTLILEGDCSIEEREDVTNELMRVTALGDSLGGVIKCIIKNPPIGLGEPFFGSVESVISYLAFSIPGVKGIEFGTGFSGCEKLGSEFNDLIIDEKGTTLTNNNGGINGGISNGNEIVFSLAVKPTASIFKTQQTFNFANKCQEILEIKGRHDVAFIMRTPVIVEAIAAMAMAELYLTKR